MEEMNNNMVDVWNNTVALADTVYIVGDFSFEKAERTEALLKRLNGRLHLIRGNHDHWMNEDTEKYFESIQDYKKIKIDGQKVIMFHYPIFEWQDMHYGSYHLFGHVHGNSTVPGRALDVGVDARPQKDMGLWSWEEVNEVLSKREIRTHHGK